MTATLTPVTRALRGEVYAVACDNDACSWVTTEFRNPRIAEAIRQRHVCQEEPP